MSKNFKIVAGATVLTLLIGGVVSFAFYLKGRTGELKAQQAQASLVLKLKDTPISLGEGYVRYANGEYGFYFEYPKDLEVNTFDEGGGAKTITFRKEKEKKGLQIFITPIAINVKSQSGEQISRNPVLSREQVIKDNPTAVVEEPLEVIFGDNTRGLLFWGSDLSIGKTREVWFIFDSYLYEVTTYADFDQELAKIMSTWRFVNQ